jgi:hypothetical protein
LTNHWESLRFNLSEICSKSLAAKRSSRSLAFGARPQPLGNAVNKLIADLIFAQVALGEGLVVLPQPLPKLRYRRSRQQKRPLSSLNASSMSRTDSPRATSRSPDPPAPGYALQMLADGRAERLIAAGNLRRRLRHQPLSSLQPTSPVAVAVSLARLRTVLVVIPDQPRRRLHPPTPLPRSAA